ncbi:DegT/DnrJ/EryC1/StrS family aminotransferase [Chitinophaga sp. Ak27]|uniref:DegT/DnrJ/EryC1/StrS family aminotransferase n=1 Tax=Chitinophaga sp. Ak27 TaxID=2726116 RepID=UPI001B7CF3D0|nr:DegT/DnrJ/EryC1/StrS family aminotransferase [Chitinophaga sp. Ak27]
MSHMMPYEQPSTQKHGAMSYAIPYENLKRLNHPFEEQFKQQLAHVLEKGWYILGEEVTRFEEEFADFHGSAYVVGVANGLDALILSLQCCGFEKGSEVIVPSNTYIATILSIIHCGLVPVLAEPATNTYNIDPAAIESLITPKTAAIMVVHLYGQCCNMGPVMDIATQHGLKVIEDCAQAHGARYKQQLAGTFGDFGAFSFYPTKNLGALGDAGAIICKSKADYLKLRQLRNYGSEKKYHNGVIGYNSRLDELQAAFLRIKLPALNSINEHKRKLAAIYTAGLDNQFIKPVVDPDYFHVYHIYNVLHSKRDELKKYLADHHIATDIHYPVAPHDQPALKGHLHHYHYPIATRIHQQTLSLPCSVIHTEEEIRHVVAVMNQFPG